MRLRQFDYSLPKQLIAQQPVKPRDHSRLLVLNKKTGHLRHKHFYDLMNYLKPGDVLALNNSKVMKARLMGRKAESGGKVEVFLLKKQSPQPRFIKGAEEIWQCLIGGKRRKEDLQVEFEHGLKAKIIKNNRDSTWLVKFNKSGAAFMKLVEKIGQAPLPPYIKRMSKLKTQNSKLKDKINYQTVYASDAKLGSVAAPTAGLHFTKRLINQLKSKGVQIEYVTLHVGLGTFAPVKVKDIAKHKMHSEYIEADKKTLENIIKAKADGRRVIAAGTTSARVLESVFRNYKFNNFSGWTDIFIYPPYTFKLVDALITNFHLPKSTLLMLVSAFAGRTKILKAYQTAVKKKYRFYSYGDAMLII